MRNAFIEELVKLADENPQIFLVVGDLGYSVVEPFAARFPDRFINAGVAEQNMTTLAAGLASEGYHVFTYSIANFPTFRCAEQIRNDVAYHNLPVTVVSVGGGLAYGNLGYSHHAVQDYALIRSMPNMLLTAPGDPMETRACLRFLVENPQPSYLRLGKAGEKNLHSEVPKNMGSGVWMPIEINKNAKHAYVTTGASAQIVFEWLKKNTDNTSSFYSVPIWSSQNRFMQVQKFKEFGSITSVEDHLIDGGFGSWLLESLPARTGLRDKLDIRALSSDVCGMVGDQNYLHNLGGLKDE